MTATPHPGLTLARTARLSLSTCFLAGGIGIGAWGVNLPALSRRASLSEGELGVVLLCFAGAAMVSMTMAPRMILRFGAMSLAVMSAMLFGIGIGFVGLLQSLIAAIPLALLMGLTFGTLDVTMNKGAASLEAAAGRPMMSSFHALFSVGTLISAAGYTLLSHTNLGVPFSMGLAGAVAAIAGFLAWSLARKSALAEPETRSPTAGSGKNPDLRMILILGAMAFLAFLSEGAVMDWAGVYLVGTLGETESTGALGFTVFILMLTLGRLIGDWANIRLGSLRLFRISAVTVAVAMAVMLVAQNVHVTFVALALSGFGIANVIPVIFSSAGRLAEGDDGRTMSRVLIMAYSGLLVGPAVIGFIAQAINLSAGLWFVVLAMAAVTIGGGFLGALLSRR